MDELKLNMWSIWIAFVWVSIYPTASTFISTACFSNNLNSRSDCIMHKLQCNESTLVIKIMGAKYGYREACMSFTGIQNCGSVECCKREDGDCFLPFNEERLRNVTQMCDGKSFCSLNGMRNFSTCKGINVNAYTLIEFTCDLKDQETTSTRTQSTATSESATQNRQMRTTSSNRVTEIIYPQTSAGIGSTETSTTHSISLKERDIVIISGASAGVFVFIIIVVIIACKVKRRSKNNASERKAVSNKTKTPIHRKSVRQYDYISVDANIKQSEKKTTVCDKRNEENKKIGGSISTNTVNWNDTYNHIGGSNSTKTVNRNDNYNHIPLRFHGSFEGSEQARGNNSCDDRMPDTYDHIGQKMPTVQIDEDTYNHIGFK